MVLLVVGSASFICEQSISLMKPNKYTQQDKRNDEKLTHQSFDIPQHASHLTSLQAQRLHY